MTDSHITLRKIVISAGAGVAGTVAGGALVRIAISTFAGSPPWALPAVIIAALTSLMATALIAPTLVEQRRRTKRRTPPWR